MQLVLGPDGFVLGVAIGMLGLVLLLSLLVALAYSEHTLLYLAAYLVLMLAFVLVGALLFLDQNLIQQLLLVTGPSLTAGLQFWLLRNRKISRAGLAAMAAWAGVTLGLTGLYVAGGDAAVASGLCVLWFLLLVTASFYLSAQAWDMAGPWKWWFLVGHGMGALLATLFLTGLADASQVYWPVLFMLLLQAPPIYLALVWRSRLLNEISLRSMTSSTVDPLTGLATMPVLVERLMRLLSRTPQAEFAPAGSTLFLIEVKNWDRLLLELGPEFNEKLLLEAALRLRRSIGDNDLVARLHGSRFAVLAHGLAKPQEITTLATRLVVSGLRIDSPMLPRVEFKFHVIVTSLKLTTPLSLPDTQAWLDRLANRFMAWPSSHNLRSILVVDSHTDLFAISEVDSSY